MTFLELVKKAASECGVSGVPATTVGQIGSLGRIVGWVNDAWNELQSERDDWSWMRSSNILGAGVSFIPAAAQYNTPLGTGAGQVGVDADGFGKWDEDTFRCYTTSNAGGIGIGAIGVMSIGGTSGTLDETFLPCIPYDAWRDGWMLGAQRNVKTRPTVIAVGPDQSLNLGSPPNGLYTITGDFWMAPSLMVADTDVPAGLPKRWHMLIVYKMMMMKYGYFEAASDVLDRGTAEWNRMYRQLEAARLPQMGFSGALA